MQRGEATSILSKPDPGAKFPETAMLIHLAPLPTVPVRSCGWWPGIRSRTKIIDLSMVPLVGCILIVRVDSPSWHCWRQGQNESKILAQILIQETQKNMPSKHCTTGSFCTSEHQMKTKFPTKS